MAVGFSRLGTLGRLGNHLFQIASVMGIAECNGTQAVFPEWKYEPCFAHPLPHGELKIAVLMEEGDHYGHVPYTLYANKDYDFYGYFQSAKYWDKATILKQFEFSPEMKAGAAKFITGKTLAISVRRGDFVNNPNYYQIPITYYLNCYYTHFGKDWNVIIFSDDLPYCRQHFNGIPNVQYADNLSDIQQLCVMSLCEAHIISNSTFSWWGAYLSRSAIVYRPQKNFAGPLAAKYSEADYWMPEWEIFNDYRIDLTDTTFLIPVFHDHEDRMQNVKITLAFLLNNFDTNVIIGEQGGNAFEGFSDYADYMQFDYPHFHRTRMLNAMGMEATTAILVNWDCDTIVSPGQLIAAVAQIRQGADIVYPFDGCVLRIPRHLVGGIAQTLEVANIPKEDCVCKFSSVGHALLMNKQSFFAAGGENENFISWSCEDAERFNRFHILGLNVQRIDGPIYHMDHYIGVNSSSKNPFFKQGEDEFFNVTGKNKEQLQEYVKTWAWAN
jgi:hypothetical protein